MRSPIGNPGWVVLWVAVTLAAGSSLAADKPAKDASRRLQQQLTVAEREKTKLSQQVAEAEGQIKDMEAKAADSQRRADVASSRIARLTRELGVTREQAVTTKTEQAALMAKLADTERQLAELKVAFGAEKQQLDGVAARQRAALADCSARNARMYKLGNDLLNKYEEKSCFSSVLQAEPFTGLKRAQIEKMIEEDREKLDKDQLPSEVKSELGRPPP